jgi:dihydrofolate reductase
MISMIAAISRKDRVIGTKEGKIPWHIKQDFQYFKEKTTGHPIIMGYKTYKSLPGILPDRKHIVISEKPIETDDDIIIVDDIESAISKAQELDNEEVFIIGGGYTYQQGLKYADRLYITLVDSENEIVGDVYFPEYENLFTKTISSRHDSEGPYTLEYLVLEK